jgi:ADP-L-glycero-D-manno-heptose 6-epimerase|tara:strand:- start:14150 stop:15019 length:870 start_codon:yes stop_codon:yes gene_type:complete
MIVVTGAAGFIGKNLVEKLSSITDEEILQVDYLDHMSPSDFLYNLQKDFFDNPISVIFHNGACSDTTVSDPSYVMERNFDYSVSLLKICIERGLRLIYASSASVYGDGPFIEDSSSNPKNLYALSKSMFDDYSQSFINNIPQLVGLRYFNVYGKYEENKGNMASVVYKFYNQLEGGEITLFKNSDKYLRDFVHVDDIVSMNIKFFLNPKISGLFNIGTGAERSFEDIAGIFKKRYKVSIKYIEMPEKLKGKYQKFTKSDNTKLLKSFSHEFFSLEQGVEKYLNYLEKSS